MVDFIQETAARGLTAVYSLSDEETQQDLVRSLVSSFTGETKQKIQVSRDTQLFEPGQLPTGDGSSVGSYGDIMVRHFFRTFTMTAFRFESSHPNHITLS